MTNSRDVSTIEDEKVINRPETPGDWVKSIVVRVNALSDFGKKKNL